MNFLKFLVIACLSLALSCRPSPAKQHFEAGLLRLKWGSKPLLFLSCTRCGCIDGELSRLWRDDSTLLQSFHIYGDLSCYPKLPQSLRHRVRPSTQGFLDSLYEENYNLVLFKKKGGKFVQKTVTTEESSQLATVLEEFLKTSE